MCLFLLGIMWLAFYQALAWIGEEFAACRHDFNRREVAC